MCVCFVRAVLCALCGVRKPRAQRAHNARRHARRARARGVSAARMRGACCALQPGKAQVRPVRALRACVRAGKRIDQVLLVSSYSLINRLKQTHRSRVG
jgi:hypothetical protein